MALYDYQGQQYDIDTDDPEEAKRKILAHVQSTKSLPQRVTEMAAAAPGALVQGFTPNKPAEQPFTAADVPKPSEWSVSTQRPNETYDPSKGFWENTWRGVTDTFNRMPRRPVVAPAVMGAVGETIKSAGAGLELVAPDAAQPIIATGKKIAGMAGDINQPAAFAGQLGSYIIPGAAAYKAAAATGLPRSLAAGTAAGGVNFVATPNEDDRLAAGVLGAVIPPAARVATGFTRGLLQGERAGGLQSVGRPLTPAQQVEYARLGAPAVERQPYIKPEGIEAYKAGAIDRPTLVSQYSVPYEQAFNPAQRGMAALGGGQIPVAGKLPEAMGQRVRAMLPGLGTSATDVAVGMATGGMSPGSIARNVARVATDPLRAMTVDPINALIQPKIPGGITQKLLRDRAADNALAAGQLTPAQHAQMTGRGQPPVGPVAPPAGPAQTAQQAAAARIEPTMGTMPPAPAAAPQPMAPVPAAVAPAPMVRPPQAKTRPDALEMMTPEGAGMPPTPKFSDLITSKDWPMNAKNLPEGAPVEVTYGILDNKPFDVVYREGNKIIHHYTQDNSSRPAAIRERLGVKKYQDKIDEYDLATGKKITKPGQGPDLMEQLRTKFKK